MPRFAAPARGRLALASTLLLTGAMATTVAAAPAASAATTARTIPAIQSCQSYEPDFTVTVTQPPNAEISVNAWEYCIPGPGGIPYHITISKYIGNNQYQTVATGTGEAFYTCTGGRYLYTTSISSAPFYCG
jgi:hypothetical protein